MKVRFTLQLLGRLCLMMAIAASVAASKLAAMTPGQDQDKNELSVKTGSGGLDLKTNVKAKDVGLPVYPGATFVNDRDKSEDNLLFNLSRSGKPDVKFVVAKFETTDDIGRVRDYYRKKLGSKVTKFEENSKDGSLSFELKSDNQHARFVGLKSSAGKTEINLVRLDGMDISDDSVK